MVGASAKRYGERYGVRFTDQFSVGSSQ